MLQYIDIEYIFIIEITGKCNYKKVHNIFYALQPNSYEKYDRQITCMINYFLAFE